MRTKCGQDWMAWTQVVFSSLRPLIHVSRTGDTFVFSWPDASTG